MIQDVIDKLRQLIAGFREFLDVTTCAKNRSTCPDYQDTGLHCQHFGDRPGQGGCRGAPQSIVVFCAIENDATHHGVDGPFNAVELGHRVSPANVYADGSA